MRVRYDKDTDILYIRLKEGVIEESDEVSTGIIIDYAEDGTPLGVEILDARKRKGIIPYKVEFELFEETMESIVPSNKY